MILLFGATCVLGLGLAARPGRLDEGDAGGAPCALRWDARAEQLRCSEQQPRTDGSNEAIFPVELALALGLPFDANVADAAALQRVRGIGRARAAAIVALRESLGGFCTLDELGGARGIGPATIERLRARLRVVPAPRCGAARAGGGAGPGAR